MAEELTRAGFAAHVAEPAETAHPRGPKRRAKTDRADARHARQLLEQGRLPCSWIPPGHIGDLRVLVRLRKTLADERTCWPQRIHALLLHHGLPRPAQALLSRETREWLRLAGLPAASRQALTLGLDRIDQALCQLDPLERWLRAYARRPPGCRALTANHYGSGELTAPTILAEPGDARRFRNGDTVVRHTGLDVTVHSSDGNRSRGHPAEQGPPALRWALFEAAQRAARASPPGS
ncbi:MAG: transposase [Egibacteraceae bacterium]